MHGDPELPRIVSGAKAKNTIQYGKGIFFATDCLGLKNAVSSDHCSWAAWVFIHLAGFNFSPKN
jgi:hypothetical protein